MINELEKNEEWSANSLKQPYKWVWRKPFYFRIRLRVLLPNIRRLHGSFIKLLQLEVVEMFSLDTEWRAVVLAVNKFDT